MLKKKSIHTVSYDLAPPKATGASCKSKINLYFAKEIGQRVTALFTSNDSLLIEQKIKKRLLMRSIDQKSILDFN